MTTEEAYKTVNDLCTKSRFTKYPSLKIDNTMKDVGGQRGDSIYINKVLFGALSNESQTVVVAHEWGHFLEQDLQEGYFKGKFISSDMIADWFTAKIGLVHELKADRKYGAEYDTIIDKYQEIEQFPSRISRWEQRKLSGIV